MTSRIPDQLRQWHAQFIAGDVLFSRIMADIDAAIACYVDPLTAEKVIELAQLYMLKIALYEAAKQLNVRDLGLLARQGCVAQALELAELWCNEPVKYFERLVAIYTALPTENSPLLDKLFALLEQRNMPEEDVEKLVKVFLKRGKPEAAWQIARQTTEFRYQHRLVAVFKQRLDEGVVELAYQQLQPYPDEGFSYETVSMLGRVAVALHNTGQPNTAQRCLNWCEIQITQSAFTDNILLTEWNVVVCALQIGDISRAVRLLQIHLPYQGYSWQYWAWFYPELQMLFANPPIALNLPCDLVQLYRQLPIRYQESPFGLAIAERLIAVGAEDMALPMFQQQVHVPELRSRVVQHLQTLGDTTTLKDLLTILQNHVETAASEDEKEFAMKALLQVLLALGRDKAAEFYLTDSRQWSAKSLHNMGVWLMELALMGDWQLFITFAKRWITNRLEQQKPREVFDTLLTAIHHALPHIRQQALEWSGQFLTEQILTLTHVYRGDGQSQRIVVNIMILAGNIPGFEKLMAAGWVPTHQVYRQAEELLCNAQSTLALRFFRRARGSHTAECITTIHREIQWVDLNQPLPLKRLLHERNLARHWKQNALDITDFIAAFTDTIPLMHAIAPDLPRRALEACVMLLLDKFMSAEQTA